MPTGLCELSDEQLIRRCKGAAPDHARAFVGELASRYVDRLTGFLFGYTGDRTVAEDLSQEAFVRVYRHRENYKEVARFSTWLYTIGRNLALNEVRNRRLRPKLVLDGGGGGESDERSEATAYAERAAELELPAERLEKDDLKARVRAEVARLPEHHREVVILCDLEERPYAEAAEILEVPVGTIRSRLSRARAQLLTRLREVWDEETS